MSNNFELHIYLPLSM